MVKESFLLDVAAAPILITFGVGAVVLIALAVALVILAVKLISRCIKRKER